MAEKTLKTEIVFKGKLLTVEVVTVELESGRQATREIVRHGGAVAVLGRRGDGRYVLIRQFRKAVEKEMLEVVAGGLEPGETPEQCAAREVAEETGYAVTRLFPLGKIIPTPGYCSEAIHLFAADLAPGAQSGRQPDEDEKLDVAILSGRQINGMIRRGLIDDGKTLALWARWEKSGHKKPEPAIPRF